MVRFFRLILSCSLCLFALEAAAKEYLVPILVDTEDDILDLHAVEDITEEERDLLLRLLEDPLDINEASRDELYDLPGLTYDLVDRLIAAREAGRFPRVSSLKAIPGIRDHVFRQIRPFLRHVPIGREPKEGPPRKVSGSFRYNVSDEISDTDTDLPEMYLQGRMEGLGGFEAGFAVTLQNGIGPVGWKDSYSGDYPAALWKTDYETGKLQCDKGNGVYNCGPGSAAMAVLYDDPLDRYLVTDGEHYRVPWPKIYVSAEGRRWRAIAGSYKIGFGQRLVIDNTGRDKPHGFEGDHTVYGGFLGQVSQAANFTGAAGSYDIGLGGRLSLELSPFFSWWRYDSYQYNLSHEDPLTGERESYTILSKVKGTPYFRKHYFVTYPQAYDELLGGANVSFKWGGRSHVGITGYGSRVGFNLGDENAVFDTNSGYPTDRTVFGAFGLDAAVEVGPDTTLYGEVAATDRISAEAMAAIIRCVWERKSVEIDVSARYLGDEYDNPHARAISMYDQWMGNTDRGEIGLRADASWKAATWLRLRLGQDVWRAARWDDPWDDAASKIHLWRNETYLRVDGYPFDWWTLGVYAQFRDNDLLTTGWHWTDLDGDREGVDYENGEQWRVGANMTFVPLEWLQLHLYYRIKLQHEDRLSLERELQRDHYVYGKLRLHPLRWLKILLRAKYHKEELTPEGGRTSPWDEYFEGYLGIDFLPIDGLSIGGLGAVLVYLAEDDSGESPSNVYGWRARVTYRF